MSYCINMNTLVTKSNNGSEWRKWDLQVQTILDDNYVSIGSYWDTLKQDFPKKCETLINKIGNENLIKQYDSKDYFFNDINSNKKTKARNYAKLFLNYLDIFTEDIAAICLTDHNYDHEYLLDAFVYESENTNVKIIVGVEINLQGVHILVLLDKIPYEKQLYSEGIKTLLSKLEINNKKTDNSLTVSNKSYTDVLKIINEINSLIIYPHCNSDNGLFQERGRTDRTHLAAHYNAQKVNILQSRNKSGVDKTINFIKTNRNLKSNYVFTIGSDSRSLKDVFSPDDAGNFCWIKADPTFEGLKQIVYEPESRIFIGENIPKKPLNTINSISLKIPVDAKVSEDKFCFAGNDNTYNLSPYFNCFIGGRGSGKSTILNFLGLHSTYTDSAQNFWEKLEPSFETNEKKIFSFAGAEFFEFLAQSEIEIFAKDKSKFTQAIYDRANSLAGKNLEEYELTIKSSKAKLDFILQAFSDLKNLEEQKVEKEKEKKTLESSVEVISSDKYKEIINGITNKSKELQNLKDWKEKITNLDISLNNLINNSVFNSIEVKEEHEKTEYEKVYNFAIAKIKEAIELLKIEKFEKEKNKENKITIELQKLELNSKKLIEKIGYTSENVEQIKSAPQKITTLESEIKIITTQIEAKKKIIAMLGSIVDELKNNKLKYESEISKILNPLQNLLKQKFEENQGKDLKQITLEYSFNENLAWKTLTEKFYDFFSSQYHDIKRNTEVCEFIIDNMGTFSKDSLKEIRDLIKQSQKNKKQYIKFLDEIFKEEKNFQIYQAIRDMHLYDVKSNKIIQVKYDDREIENASFGQRCTAVIVILLLFGNYPLIIDEPEAHLDSSLIANYLVPLLKEKKSDRQIIFATHNANFVINGDAEKIFILKNESGQTDIIETTIENTNTREELLKLEGGKEAFAKRGEKLNI